MIFNLLSNEINKWFIYLNVFLIFKVIPSMGLILFSPFTNPDMMWIVTPLLISMILMQLYFGRHRNEELGWNTAFGNSISLIFVSINLLQFIYNQFGWNGFNLFHPLTNKIYLVLFLGLISLTQLIINYFHLIPKKIAFFINSAVLTNMTAFISIILVYTNIPLNIETIIASFVLLSIFIIVFNWFKNLIPMSKEAEEYIIKMKRKEEHKKAWLAKMELRQERASDAKITDSLISIGFIILTLFLILVIKTFIEIPIWIILLIQALVYIITTIFILVKRKLNIYNLNFDGEFKEILIGILLSPLLFWLTNIFIYIYSFFIRPQSILFGNNLLLNVIIYILLLPIGTELIFRGIIQRSLECHINKHTAIILQAILFSLINFSFLIIISKISLFSILTIPIFLINSILLGYIRDKWGLESVISLHMFFNVIGLFT